MSININVSGNPVKISHGKMVTACSENSKEEFHKRRLMRLEQVHYIDDLYLIETYFKL